MIRALSTVALATAALLSLAAPAHAAESASFIGSGSSQFFGFEIDYAATLTGSVVSSFSGLAGYDITSVTIDGLAFPDLLPAVGADYFEFSLNIAAGTHYDRDQRHALRRQLRGQLHLDAGDGPGARGQRLGAEPGWHGRHRLRGIPPRSPFLIDLSR